MSKGMEPFYNEFETIPNISNKEENVEKIYNKIITVDKKDIDLITDIPISYPLVVMDTIAEYLNKKYKCKKGETNYIKIVTEPITQFTFKYKTLNPSVNGKRASEVLSSLSRFVEYVKNRSTLQKLTGTGDKNE